MEAVAKLAGVSTTTVFRVVNGEDGVSPDCVRQVQEAMDEIGYQPKPRRRRSRTDGKGNPRLGNVVLLNIGKKQRGFFVPVVAGAIESLQSQLAERNANLVVRRISPDSETLPPVLTEHETDGVILMGDAPSTRLARRLEKIPTVRLFTGHPAVQPLADSVTPDHLAIGQLAAEYLLNKNVKRAAMIRFRLQHAGNDIRQFAWERDLHKNGVGTQIITAGQAVEDLCVDPQGIRDLIRNVVQETPRIDGVFIPTDLLTPLAVEEFKQQGRTPGENLHLITCNNDPSVSQTMGQNRPATIDLNTDEMAHRAIDQLIRRASNGNENTYVTIMVAPTLVQTTSTQ